MTGGYRRNLADLRRAHHKLYSQATHVQYQKYAILGSTHGLVTCTLRVRATPGNHIAHLRYRAARTLTRLYAELGGQPVFEVSLTANFVLARTDDFGERSYSVFYGQSFGQSERDFENRHLRGLGPPARDSPWPKVLRHAGDVSKIPEVVTPDDVSGEYERIFDQSSVTVHSIINYVLIFRSFLPRYYRPGGPAAAAASADGSFGGRRAASHLLARAQKVNKVLRI